MIDNLRTSYVSTERKELCSTILSDVRNHYLANGFATPTFNQKSMQVVDGQTALGVFSFDKF